MDTRYIYLAGGMGSLSLVEQTKWRKQVKNRIFFDCYDYRYTPLFTDPTIYYNFVTKSHKTEREVFEYDLNAVRKSDLIIVNFNDPKSIGTAMELAVARENRIPIVGLNEYGKELHPWLIEVCTRICDTMDELVAHVVDFYLT